MTLLLGNAELGCLLDIPSSIRALRSGFTADLASLMPPRRIRQGLPSAGSIAVLLPGLLPHVPAYSVKVNAKYPGSTPAISGIVCLVDLDSGDLLAILDSAFVTAWRTGLSAALVTHTVASPVTRAVGIIGAGVQADLTLRGLTWLRTIERCFIYDTDPARAEHMAAVWQTKGLTCRVVVNAREVAQCSDLIITATWSRQPVLNLTDIRSPAHITSLGADEPGKAELEPALLESAQVIVDDIDLALTSGALGTAGLSREHAAATAAGLILGTARIRGSDEVTVYTPVGLPWQDLAISWLAYQAAKREGIGLDFSFGHDPK